MFSVVFCIPARGGEKRKRGKEKGKGGGGGEKRSGGLKPMDTYNDCILQGERYFSISSGFIQAAGRNQDAKGGEKE